MEITMRQPCKTCGCPDGRIEKRSDQNCVFCVQCGKYAGYNAPKHETGEARRTLSDRPDIKPSQRARLLERALYRCELSAAAGNTCPPGNLVIAHFLSVKDGRDLGATDEELFSDENMLVSCELCNSGQGAISIAPRLMLRILRARLVRSGIRQALESVK